MRNEFNFNGNVVVYEDAEDGPVLDDLCTVYTAIGMLLHYAQQCGGKLFVDNLELRALSMSQTCGSAICPEDYIGIVAGDKLAFCQFKDILND